MKIFARWIARSLFADYNAYYIYFAPDRLRQAPELPADLSFLPVDGALALVLQEHLDESIRRLAPYADGSTPGFALTRDRVIVSVVFYAGRDAYTSDEVWKLGTDDAALLEIATATSARGESLAPLLIQLSEQAMRESGKRQLIAWIWWSHTSSRRAFNKAGWTAGSFTASVKVRGLRRRLVWRTRRSQARDARATQQHAADISRVRG